MNDKTNELLHDMLMSPTSNKEIQPMLEEEQETKQDEDNREKIEYLFGSKSKQSEKYKEKILKKAKENPRAVMIKTPEGEMTLQEALEKGYNPKTKKFDRQRLPKKPSLDDKQMNPETIAKLKKLMDPRAMNISQEEMRKRGMNPRHNQEYLPSNQPEEPEVKEKKDGMKEMMLSMMGGKA